MALRATVIKAPPLPPPLLSMCINAPGVGLSSFLEKKIPSFGNWQNTCFRVGPNSGILMHMLNYKHSVTPMTYVELLICLKLNMHRSA